MFEARKSLGCSSHSHLDNNVPIAALSDGDGGLFPGSKSELQRDGRFGTCLKLASHPQRVNVLRRTVDQLSGVYARDNRVSSSPLSRQLDCLKQTNPEV